MKHTQSTSLKINDWNLKSSICKGKSSEPNLHYCVQNMNFQGCSCTFFMSSPPHFAISTSTSHPSLVQGLLRKADASIDAKGKRGHKKTLRVHHILQQPQILKEIWTEIFPSHFPERKQTTFRIVLFLGKPKAANFRDQVLKAKIWLSDISPKQI